MKEWPKFFDEFPEPFNLDEFNLEFQHFLKYEANNMEKLEYTKLSIKDIDEHAVILDTTYPGLPCMARNRLILEMVDRFDKTFGENDERN